MKVNKKYLVILTIIYALYSAFATSLPLLTKILVDRAINKANDIGHWKDLYVVIIALIAVVLIEVVLILLKNVLSNSFRLKLEHKLKTNLFNNMLAKDINDITIYNKAYLEQLFNSDIDNIITRDLEIIPGIIKDILRVILSSILVLYYDWRFLLGLILCGILGFGCAKIYSHIIKPRHNKALEAEAKLSGFLLDSVSNIKLIKAYEANDYANNYFNDCSNTMILEKKRRNRVNVIASSGIFGFCNILYVIALCYGGYAIAIKLFSYGTLIALLQLLSYIENPFLNFSHVLNKLSLSSASKDRINNLLSLNDEKSEKVELDFNSICINNLSFSYDKLVLNNLNATINKGDKVLIEGPSGIGKSTLIFLLLGILKPDSGNITISYNNKQEEISNNTRCLFSYVPQQNILFNASIRNNIYILTGVKDINKINDALKLSNIYDEINSLPQGIDTILGERGEGLSLGQLQRVLIAIALLRDAPVLLLDEFSSALDKANEEVIMNNLIKLNKTIIYITHRSTKLNNDLTISLGE